MSSEDLLKLKAHMIRSIDDCTTKQELFDCVHDWSAVCLVNAGMKLSDE